MSQDPGSNPYDSPQTPGGGPDPRAAEAVSGPAMGLMVTAGIGIALQILGLIMNLLGAGMGAAAAGAADDQGAAMGQMMSGGLGIISAIIGIIIGVVVFMGAQKMKNLENYGFAMTSSILAMIPCISPCCLLGLPIGIWALTVITKPEIKSAFRG